MKYCDYLEKYPDITFGRVNVRRLYESCPDQESFSYEDTNIVVLDDFQIYLKHSRDEWVIGGIKDAKEFFKDLFNAIAFVEEELKEGKK